MADVQPFKGIIFNREKVDIDKVIAPPYDVIDSRLQNELYNKHSNNIIKIELGRSFHTDSKDNNCYIRANNYLRNWLSENILEELSESAIFPYEQIFFVGDKQYSRLGIIAAVRLEKFEKGIILPHERTLPKAQSDRLMLLKACRANISPIFSIYSDESKEVEKTLNNTNRELLFDTCDENDVEHKLWKITDEKTINGIQNLFQEKTIYIADGHHRYSTALMYRDEMRKEKNASKDNNNPNNFVMMMLVNTFCDGLIVLSAHRLIRNIDKDKLRNAINLLSDFFYVEKCDLNLDGFIKTIKEKGKESHAFGLYLPNDAKFILTLIDKKVTETLAGNGSKDLKELDVTILHELIFERILGLQKNAAEEGSIKFEPNEENTAGKVESGAYQMAFFINSTKVEQVQKIAKNGEIMPQKSTYFYPKVWTGLVMRSLEI